ncbi:unnamed protein product [Miscanthus lutarioriparius]|uniref:F-box domain-containing protein n=1 Tax=Miscanthus lutarioriparius TaxID=422564 RepID=A0A811N573_9POAL|nr:unnamed protein product [Miscanthus lutarioriparius]
MAARGACGECRKWQLDRDCCRVGLLRRSTRRLRRRADDADHISSLPDDLLLQILAGLGCARAAANTSLLSRRWRGLWTRSPQLIFHEITPEQLHAALGQIARPAGSLRISIPIHHMLTPDRISSLLGAAAPLAPAELSVDIHADGCSDADAVDLPCFDRTASLSLHFDPRLRLPPAGDLTALESLSFGSCHMALGDLLPRCPCLRKLSLSSWQYDSITVHSTSLQELYVSAPAHLRRVDIVAPVLKKLTFSSIQGISDEFSLSLSAPLVVDHSWYFGSWSTFGGIWRVWSLQLKTLGHFVQTQQTDSREDTCLQPQHRAHGNILLLRIGAEQNFSDGMAVTFEQEISQSQVRNLSVLELKIVPRGHVYGAMVLDLLRFCTSVQKLKVELNRYQRKACHVNCHCDQPNNWKDQIISVTVLKEVKIDGFNGEDHEVGLLKVLLRCAALLQSVTMNLSRNVSRRRSCSAYMELPSLLKAHPSVKFNIYSWCGDQVLFG